MLHVLIAVAIAIPLYEIVRALALRKARKSLRDRARAYAEQHGVRVDPFKFGGKALVREELLNDLVIAQGMMKAVHAGERPTEVRERVEEYIDEIVPAFSLTAYFQVGMKLARAAIRAVYRPLVDEESRKRISALPDDATAVFLINHRSNFDYVVVGWALARQVAISYAVGEWARVFPLDVLFKAFGGFFVRRGFPDPLYHTVLRRYLQLITRRGVTQGIFPEGGLTRDGALRSPKVGLLEALLQLADEPGFDRELYFVPVGINYDRVLEDDSLLGEKRGREHPPTPAEKVRGALRLLWIVPWRAFVNALRVATGRLQRHGYVAVAFGEPLRWKAFAQERGFSLKGLSDEERRGVAKEVAVALMERIAQVIPATPVPLVARAALELKLDATETDLVVRVRELQARLLKLGVPTALGREFDVQRAARKELDEASDRNRDLLRLEGDVLEGEVAEQIVRLGLERLLQRQALAWSNGRVVLGPKPHAVDLLEYYSRSLAALDAPAAAPQRAHLAVP